MQTFQFLCSCNYQLWRSLYKSPQIDVVFHPGLLSTLSSAKHCRFGKYHLQWRFGNWSYSENYISTLLCANCILLFCTIFDNDTLPAEVSQLTNFTTCSFACAPLIGDKFQANWYTGFQKIDAFTTGQSSEGWIKFTCCLADEQCYMKALCDHFSGEGNPSCNILETERLWKTIYYKSKRSIKVKSFLTQNQKMFNIFEKKKEFVEDDAKLRFIFKKVQHTRQQRTAEVPRVT